MLNLLSGVIRNDPSAYGGYEQDGGSCRPRRRSHDYGQVARYPAYMLRARARRHPVTRPFALALALTLDKLDSSWKLARHLELSHVTRRAHR